MRVSLDTNVILNVLLNRAPWVKAASAIWQAVDDDSLTAYIVSCTLTNIDYIARRLTNSERAHTAVKLCLDTFEICTVEQRTLIAATALAGHDFEDNVQIACAMLYGLDATIITRDTSGFQAAAMPVLTPDEFLKAHMLNNG